MNKILPSPQAVVAVVAGILIVGYLYQAFPDAAVLKQSRDGYQGAF